jgi:hypothetical protein
VTSQVAFAVRLDPADAPDGQNSLVLGEYDRSIVVSSQLNGNFGQFPPPAAHLDNGVFFRSLSVSAAGPPSIEVSLYQAVPGDSNGQDGFSSSDLVLVFSSNEYEDNVAQNSNWQTGDWNHDGEFSSTDLILAFQAGYYELAALAIAGRDRASDPARQAAAAVDATIGDWDDDQEET